VIPLVPRLDKPAWFLFGKWLIMHHQNSVPVDLEHGKAVLDLKP
jgi:hypothetical protein